MTRAYPVGNLAIKLTASTHARLCTLPRHSPPPPPPPPPHTLLCPATGAGSCQDVRVSFFTDLPVSPFRRGWGLRELFTRAGTPIVSSASAKRIDIIIAEFIVREKSRETLLRAINLRLRLSPTLQRLAINIIYRQVMGRDFPEEWRCHVTRYVSPLYTCAARLPVSITTVKKCWLIPGRLIDICNSFCTANPPSPRPAIAAPGDSS